MTLCTEALIAKVDLHCWLICSTFGGPRTVQYSTDKRMVLRCIVISRQALRAVDCILRVFECEATCKLKVVSNWLWLAHLCMRVPINSSICGHLIQVPHCERERCRSTEMKVVIGKIQACHNMKIESIMRSYVYHHTNRVRHNIRVRNTPSTRTRAHVDVIADLLTLWNVRGYISTFYCWSLNISLIAAVE